MKAGGHYPKYKISRTNEGFSGDMSIRVRKKVVATYSNIGKQKDKVAAMLELVDQANQAGIIQTIKETRRKRSAANSTPANAPDTAITAQDEQAADASQGEKEGDGGEEDVTTGSMLTPSPDVVMDDN